MNTTTNDDLFDYFSQFGQIVKCEAQMWKNNPAKCRGFAVLTVGSRATYDSIMTRQHVLGGRTVECKPLVKDRSQLSSYCREELDKKIYVSGISKKVTDSNLRDYFSKYGEVKIAYIVRHHKDNKPKGFGFVSFASRESKEAALRQAEHTLLGKQIFCTEYSTKAELKKGSKPKTCKDTEDEDQYPTSENFSDQETQANYGSRFEEGGQAMQDSECQGSNRKSSDQGFYDQELIEGCRNYDFDSTSDHCKPYFQEDCKEFQGVQPSTRATLESTRKPSFYNPFKGSNGLLYKMGYSWPNSH